MWRTKISRAINRHFLGGIDEMVCSRAYRLKLKQRYLWNTLAFWHLGDHCRKCYIWELQNGLQEKLTAYETANREAQKTALTNTLRTAKREAVARYVEAELHIGGNDV